MIASDGERSRMGFKLDRWERATGGVGRKGNEWLASAGGVVL